MARTRADYDIAHVDVYPMLKTLKTQGENNEYKIRIQRVITALPEGVGRYDWD